MTDVTNGTHSSPRGSDGTKYHADDHHTFRQQSRQPRWPLGLARSPSPSVRCAVCGSSRLGGAERAWATRYDDRPAWAVPCICPACASSPIADTIAVLERTRGHILSSPWADTEEARRLIDSIADMEVRACTR